MNKEVLKRMLRAAIEQIEEYSDNERVVGSEDEFTIASIKEALAAEGGSVSKYTVHLEGLDAKQVESMVCAMKRQASEHFKSADGWWTALHKADSIGDTERSEKCWERIEKHEARQEWCYVVVNQLEELIK